MLLLGVACGAEDAFVDVGNANGEAFRVEVASIQRDGDIVRYRVFSKAPPRLRLQMDYEGHIAADCAKRLRVAYVNIARFERGTSRSTNDPTDMKSVFNGTRQAEELDIVCALARSNPPGGALQAATTSPPQPAPAPKVTAARLMSTATGIVVSTSGHVVVSSRVTAGCASLVAVVGGRRQGAEVLATDNGMALLKMAATVSTPLAGSPHPVAAGAPVTVLGYPPQAKPGAEPVVAAAVVRGGTDPARVDLAFASAAALVEGPALGEQGDLVGFVTLAGGAQSSTRAIPAARLRAFLEQQGVTWPAVGRERPLAVSEILRRGLAGTALVACYTDQ
jgi:hypothetical protein